MCEYGTDREVVIERRLSVDACIASTVVWLNRMGVYTTGSCCGHGREAPSVTILPSSADRARSLGYVVTCDASATADPSILVTPDDWQRLAMARLTAYCEAVDVGRAAPDGAGAGAGAVSKTAPLCDHEWHDGETCNALRYHRENAPHRCYGFAGHTGAHFCGEACDAIDRPARAGEGAA